MSRRWFACALCMMLFAQASAQQPQVLAPGENLVVEGLPPIPASLVEQAGPYTEYRSASLFDWHPTRRAILIGTRFADTNQVHEVATPLGDRRQLTFFPDRVMGAAFQPKQASYFILSKDRGGNEFFQFYRHEPAGGSARRNRNDVDFYLMNPAKPETDKLLTENPGGGWGVVAWSTDDKQLLVLESISINEGYVWLVDVASGKKTMVTPKASTEKIAYEPVAFSHDGKFDLPDYRR
jgi:hypothetical protein